MSGGLTWEQKMTFYATDKNRRRAPARGPRTRPGRGAPVSPGRPGNDNTPPPANDNPRAPRPPRPDLPRPGAPTAPRRPPGTPARPRIPRWLIPGYGFYQAFDYGYRRWYEPGAVPPAPPGWHHVHGPNTYLDPYPDSNTKLFDSGYIAPWQGWGPQTGMIAGQGRSILLPSAAEYSARYSYLGDMGEWIQSSELPWLWAQKNAWLNTAAWKGEEFNNWLRENFPEGPDYFHKPYPIPDAFSPYQPWDAPGNPGALPRPQPLPSKHTPGRGNENEGPAPGPEVVAPRPSLIVLPGGQLVMPPVAPAPTTGPSWPVQSFTTAGGAGRAPRNSRGGGRHRNEPPKARTREKKGRMARALWGALNAFGQFTEGIDLVDAAWKALPKDARSRSFHKGQYVRPAWHKRANDVWKNWDKIDLEQFAKNVLANQMEDAFYGLQGKGFNPSGRVQPDLAKDYREQSGLFESPVDFDKLVDDVWSALKEQGST